MTYKNNSVPWKFHPKLKVKGPSKTSTWSLLARPRAALFGLDNDDDSLPKYDRLHLLLLVLVVVLMATVAALLIELRRSSSRRAQYQTIV
jgi:hypothetical protein